MEVQLIKLNKIKVNDKNPRTITEDKLRRLVESILVFPKMLSIRPIVVDDKGVALGGNMRTRALKEIKKLGRDGLQPRLQEIRQFGSDMGDAVTGGGLHGKDLSKADVSVNIYAHLKAVGTRKPVEITCAIGDDTVDGHPYSEIVDIARQYIRDIGGFEKFAEWGLIR